MVRFPKGRAPHVEERRISSGLLLEVAEASQSDVGNGDARVDTKTREALGVVVGEIVEIIGKKSTAAKLLRIGQEDEGKGLVRMDGLVRRNASVDLGDKVEVRKAEVVPAAHVTIAPIISEGHKISFGQGIENFVKRGLIKRPLTQGDVVIVSGIALMGGALPFMVLTLAPPGIGEVTRETVFRLSERPVHEDEVLEPATLIRILVEDLRGILMSHDRGIDGLKTELGDKTREARKRILGILDDLEREASCKTPEKE